MKDEDLQDSLGLGQPWVSQRLLETRTLLIAGEITSRLAERVVGQLRTLAAESDADGRTRTRSGDLFNVDTKGGHAIGLCRCRCDTSICQGLELQPNGAPTPPGSSPGARPPTSPRCRAR